MDSKPGSVIGPARTVTPRWMYALLAVFAAAAATATYRMVDTSGQLTAIERERLSLLQEKGRLDNALASARKQVDELKSVQATSESEIKKSREDAKAASTQSVQFQERAKALEAELNGVRQDLANATKSRSDVETRGAALERDLNGLKAQITDLQQKLTASEANLRAALDAKTRAEQQVQHLQKLTAPAPQAPQPAQPPRP